MQKEKIGSRLDTVYYLVGSMYVGYLDCTWRTSLRLKTGLLPNTTKHHHQ